MRKKWNIEKARGSLKLVPMPRMPSHSEAVKLADVVRHPLLVHVLAVIVSVTAAVPRSDVLAVYE